MSASACIPEQNANPHADRANPDAVLLAARKTAAERTPVIILDAGHGESTGTESYKKAAHAGHCAVRFILFPAIRLVQTLRANGMA